jgi:hypothetical protein
VRKSERLGGTRARRKEEDWREDKREVRREEVRREEEREGVEE